MINYKNHAMEQYQTNHMIISINQSCSIMFCILWQIYIDFVSSFVKGPKSALWCPQTSDSLKCQLLLVDPEFSTDKVFRST